MDVRYGTRVSITCQSAAAAARITVTDTRRRRIALRVVRRPCGSSDELRTRLASGSVRHSAALAEPLQSLSAIDVSCLAMRVFERLDTRRQTSVLNPNCRRSIGDR